MGGIIYLVFWLLIVYLGISFFVFSIYVVKAINSAKICKKYVRYAGSPVIAFFGDSTGYGVGATCARNTLPGLIAELNPRASITNSCKSGAKIKDTIKAIKRNNKFDVMFVCSGGMDILKMSKYSDIKKDVHDLFELMDSKCSKSVFISPANLGLSLAFPWFLRIFYWNRSLEVGLIIKKEARKFKNIQVVNNLLLKDLKKMPNYKNISSNDRIHPNDEGYAWVLDTLSKKVKIRGLKFNKN